MRDKLETFWTMEHATSIGTMQPSLPETYRRVLEVCTAPIMLCPSKATLDVVEYSMFIGLQLKQSKALLRQRWICRYPFAPVPSFCQHWPSGESTYWYSVLELIDYAVGCTNWQDPVDR